MNIRSKSAYRQTPSLSYEYRNSLSLSLRRYRIICKDGILGEVDHNVRLERNAIVHTDTINHFKQKYIFSLVCPIGIKKKKRKVGFHKLRSRYSQARLPDTKRVELTTYR